LIYTCIKNVILINVYKTLILWRIGFRNLAYVCRRRGPIWFINLDVSFSNVIQYSGNLCGEMSWTNRWAQGLITNYKAFSGAYRHLQKISSYAYKSRQRWILNNLSEWLLSRDSWPRAIFVSSVHYSFRAVQEAGSFRIPCFGIIDSNTPCTFIAASVPGNDESMECQIFYNNSVANFILMKKFSVIMSWFFFYSII